MSSARNTPVLPLDKVLANAQLPALPQSAIKLLELSKNPDVSATQFATVIETDPGLAVQVLKFVNSSYFGFAREITNVKLAVQMVGIRTIKNFSLWSAVFSMMPNPKCGPFELKRLWQDSLRRGLFARGMAKVLGVKEIEEPFAAALLQDMAVPLLAKAMPEEYATLLAARNDGQVRLSTLEQEHFGWTHAEAGFAIAKQWNLPESLAFLLRDHCHGCKPGQTGNPAQYVVAMSALLPSSIDSVWQDVAVFETNYNSYRPSNAPDLPTLFAQIDKELAEFAPVMKLTAPPKSLVESLQAATQTA